MSTDPPQHLFFADSDDEDVSMEPLEAIEDLPILETTSMESSGTLLGKRLFTDSDDEDAKSLASEPLEVMPPVSGDECLSDTNVNAIHFDDQKPPSSASSNVSSRPTSPRASSVPTIPDAVKFPAKKPRISPPNCSKAATFTSGYIGSFLVGNAWSTAKGRGYVKPGDEIRIERDEVTSKKVSKPAPAKATKAKKSDGFFKQNPVQLSLATMMKAPPPKNKKSVDSVVRLTNMRGFEFGRLPQDVSVWISRLLDMGLVEFRGSTIIDCPEVLQSGADLIVSLSVYLRASAFKNPNLSKDEPSPKVLFNEGQETPNEQYLRERKNSLHHLFRAVGLKPRRGHQVSEQDAKKGGNDSVLVPERRKGTARTEIVGDGEEIEVEDGEELTENDLNLIYKRAQANDRAMKEMEPADTFTLTLRGYQKQALFWMHSIETGTEAARKTESMHPLWNEYVFPVEPQNGLIDLTEDDVPFYFNPYSGELSLDFPKAQRNCRGGILADEMGMGKTIMLSALIQTNCQPDSPDERSTKSHNRRQLKLDSNFRVIRQSTRQTKGPAANLIVAPTSLLSQWSDEITRSSKPGTTKIVVWHGQNRHDLVAAIQDDHDKDETIKVVITSYGVLASEHAKSEKSTNGAYPIFEIEWLRVICDEAHNCKSRTSKTARAVYALRARNKWAVTGTPIVNKLEDLHSLLRFIGFAPWSDYSFFRSFITLPFLAHDPKAIEIVQVVLESVVLRREKNMRDTDGKPIVELPTKQVIIEKVELSTFERRLYDSIYTDVKLKFDRLNAKGLVRKNYTHILAMLMRLRRAVLHPNLVLPSEEEMSSRKGLVDVEALVKSLDEEGGEEGNRNIFAKSVLDGLGDDSPSECPICLDIIEERMLIPECMHQCCKDCIVSYLLACEQKNEPGRCPTCLRTGVKETDLLEVLRPKVKEELVDPTLANRSDQPTSDVTLRRNDFRSSTKLDALTRHLQRLQDQDPCFRAVVFSQFTSFMDLIQTMLQRENFDQLRFDGTMNVKKRKEAIEGFREPSRKPKVLLVSLKAGGVGLNLTTANHVFMMDCWWNAAVENQAIDRVHRIGQEKTVYVTHFITTNTIEGRILRIQKRKTAIIKEAFRGKGADGADPESIENLNIMFAHGGDEDEDWIVG